MTKHERLIKKFSEQLQFIQRSCEIYDRGFEDESIRIATSLRIIFHDTIASKSLIRHLKLGSKKMLSSARGWDDHRDYLSWVLNINSQQPVTTKPILGNEFREISIKEWWESESAFVYKTQKYSRKKIVLGAANKDGGAHVDAELENFYEALSSGENGFSINGNLEYNGEPPFQQGVNQYAKNAHLALIRQFAHEVITAINHFNWLKPKS